MTATKMTDGRWGWTATPRAKKVLLWGTNAYIVVTSVFLIFIADDIWSGFGGLHGIVIFCLSFMLRKSVRLVADSPDEDLDERLVQLRNRAYLSAYRGLAGLVTVVLLSGLILVVILDASGTSDGISYGIDVTYIQIQGIFWLLFGYMLWLPSMAMIANELGRRKP